MEYVQTVLVRIAAEKLGDATASQGVIAELEAHRAEARRRPGFLRMTITRSAEEGGDSLLSVETRWRNERAVSDYTAAEPNVVSIVRKHRDETVPDSMQVRRMEALESEHEESKRGVVYERFALALLVPVGIVAFGLAIIYALSRVYLEIGNKPSTGLAAVIALLILLIAWYFASNPGAVKVQAPALALAVAALLIGGTVYAQVHEGPHFEKHDENGGGEPTPAPGGGDFVLSMHDNFFEFNGEQHPTIQVGANADVTIPLQNQGSALHNVHVAASGSFDAAFCTTGGPAPCSDPARISGGADGTLTFNLAPGTYDFRCDFHPAEMTGTFEVVEGGPTGPAETPPGGAPGGEATPPAEGEGGAQTIELQDNVFVVDGKENPTITVAANTDATFTLDNTGSALHNMHVAAGGEFADQFCSATSEAPCSDPPRITGGSTGTITINLPPGTYDYRCDFHAADMHGTIEVQ
jgi:plastocyanin/heme-degrading monooxygenase HmoA